MPTTKTPSGNVEFSVRLPAEEAIWTYKLADEQQGTLSTVVQRILQDARTLYRLPKAMVKALRADAKALGLERRDYIYYLLRMRFIELAQKKPGWDKAKVAKVLYTVREEEAKEVLAGGPDSKR